MEIKPEMQHVQYRNCEDFVARLERLEKYDRFLPAIVGLSFLSILAGAVLVGIFNIGATWLIIISGTGLILTFGTVSLLKQGKQGLLLSLESLEKTNVISIEQYRDFRKRLIRIIQEGGEKPRYQKKIVWAFETSEVEARAEIKESILANCEFSGKWYLGQHEPPAKEACDALVYVLEKSSATKIYLRRAVEFVELYATDKTLFIYTRYANNDRLLDSEEMSIVQDCADMTITNRLSSSIQSLRTIA